MTYRLMVSRNCGISYAPEAEAETVEELQRAVDDEELDKRMLRWTIEDESGEIEVFCPLYAQLLEPVIRARQREEMKRSPTDRKAT